LVALIGVPFMAAAMCWLLNVRFARFLLFVVAIAEMILTAAMWQTPAPSLGRFFGIDALTLLCLSLVVLVFAAASVYLVSHLRHEEKTLIAVCSMESCLPIRLRLD